MINKENKKIKLDLGCGMFKKEGTIGVDFNPNTQADIVHDLNQFPYPFPDDYADEIYCSHILEHLPNLVKVMEEMHRIGKPGCKVFIKVPYWSSYRAFKDPTHTRFFTEETFDYFTPQSKCNFYTKARFKILKKKLILSSRKPVRILGTFLPITFLKLFNNLISEIHFELEVIKDNNYFKKGERVPKVSIVILNWNNYQDSKECLQSLKRVTYPNYEVVLVDNGSTDGSDRKLKKEFPQCKFIQTGANLGFSGGCNAGVKYALENGTNYILLLNNDTIVKEDFLEPLVKAAESNKEIGIVGGKAYYYNEPNRIHMAGAKIDWLRATYKRYGAGQIDKGQFDKSKEVGFTSAYFMLVKRKVFEKIGLLSEQYFLGMEECDFGVRAARKGYKFYYVPDSVIWHKIAKSHIPATPRNIYCTYRNKLIFIRKFLPPLKWKLWRFGFYIYANSLALLKLSGIAKKYGRKPDLRALKIAISRAFQDAKVKDKVTLKDLEKIRKITSNIDPLNYD